MSKFIDAEAYKAAHKNAYEAAMMECGKGDDTRLARRVYEAVIKSVDAMPAADVQEVKHGRWIDVVGAGGMLGTFVGWKCTICGYEITDRYGQYNYCPNCGAKMDEVEK